MGGAASASESTPAPAPGQRTADPLPPAPAAQVPFGTASLCDGQSCTGLDPMRARSSVDGSRCTLDAYTPSDQFGPARIASPEGLIELVYSPHCHANWARISHSSPGAWVWVQTLGNEVQQNYVPAGRNNTHTGMVDGYTLTRAGAAYGYTRFM
ncbi:DUF2690 domain-containing protein [Streptomyces violascens]